MKDPRQLLHSVFGYNSFRGEQAAIVDHVANGGDALVLMPTGGGKSLCYQLPALLRPGCGIVVSPLIALMQDQVDALLQSGVKAAFLNSSQDFEAAVDTERRLMTGQLDLLYVAPERLLSDRYFKAPNGNGWGYCVFAKVVDGMDVVDAIKSVNTGNAGFHQDVPKEDVVIERTEVV